jgi:putative membrane protein
MPSDPPSIPPPGAEPPPGGAATPAAAGPPPTAAHPDPATAATRFATPRRLHPASVALGVPFGQLVRGAILPLFAGFAAGGRIFLGFLVLSALLAIPLRILSWQRRVFSFDGEVLRVDSGVLSRSHRSLDVARIQQVEIQRGPIQRALGLAALRVETAGSASEPEVDLRVLPEDDAVALRAAVRAGKARKEGRPLPASATGTVTDTDGAPLPDDEDDGEEIVAVPLARVALAGVTGAQLLVLPAVIGGLLQFIGQQLSTFVDEAVDTAIELGISTPEGELFGGFDLRLILAVSALVLVLTLVSAATVSVVRDGNFRMVLRDGDLHVTRGLLTRRESVVPLRRVQLVEVHRNWLRRSLGFATVRIRSAGGSTGGDGRVTVPLVRAEAVDPLLAAVLPGTPGVPPLTSHPRAALRRALFRWLRPTVLALGIVWFITLALPTVTPLIVTRSRWWLLALLPVASALAVVEYRQLAHGLTDRVVAARQGALSVATTIAPVVKVQGVTTRSNLFQRRLGLRTVVVAVAGPAAVVEVLDAGAAEARELHARLVEHAAAPIPRPLERDAATPSGGGEPGPA